MGARHKALEDLARDLLDQEGLDGWQFRWNNRKTALGICRYSQQVVEVSRPLFDANNDDCALDTLAHEVAHAVAGPFAGHGPVWQVEAVRLGAVPDATAPAAPASYRWCGRCDDGCKIWRHRLAASLRHGARCQRHDNPVEWVRVGQ